MRACMGMYYHLCGYRFDRGFVLLHPVCDAQPGHPLTKPFNGKSEVIFSPSAFELAVIRFNSWIMPVVVDGHGQNSGFFRSIHFQDVLHGNFNLNLKRWPSLIFLVVPGHGLVLRNTQGIYIDEHDSLKRFLVFKENVLVRRRWFFGCAIFVLFSIVSPF